MIQEAIIILCWKRLGGDNVGHKEMRIVVVVKSCHGIDQCPVYCFAALDVSKFDTETPRLYLSITIDSAFTYQGAIFSKSISVIGTVPCIPSICFKI